MRASIIVPVFNNSHLTMQCIENLLKYTSEEIDIIIADDYSSEIEFEKLIQNLPKTNEYRRLDVYRSPCNVGFSRICNQAAEFVRRRTNLLIFLNNDVTITRDWINLLSKFDKNVGICGSKLLYPESKFSEIHGREILKGTIQHAGIIVDADCVPYHAFRFEHSDLIEANICSTYPYVTGASFAIKKEIFEDIGGFSGAYVNGCEDIDLCIKVRQVNKIIVYCPESLAFHHETATRKPETTKDNLVLLLKEHRLQLEQDIGFVPKEIS